MNKYRSRAKILLTIRAGGGRGGRIKRNEYLNEIKKIIIIYLSIKQNLIIHPIIDAGIRAKTELQPNLHNQFR